MKIFGIRLALLALCLCPLLGSAQPDPANHPPADPPKGGGPAWPGGPGGPPLPPNNPPALMINLRTAATVATPHGLFVYAGGTLARYTLDLAQCTTVSLFGPPQLQVPENRNPEEQQQLLERWAREQQLRNAPPALLADGDTLYLVVAGTFFRVNQQTMQIDVKQALEPQENNARPNMSWYISLLLQKQGDTLFVISGSVITALDAHTGENRGRAELPREMLPAMPPARLLEQPVGKVPPDRPDRPAAREVTLVGTLAQRMQGNHTAWLVKDDEGRLYQLEGDLPMAVPTDKANGARARISGTVEPRDGLPEGVSGILTIKTMQLLDA